MNIAIPASIGLICVDEVTKEVINLINPLYNIYPQFINDIRNELEVLQTQSKQIRSFASFSRTHILNYFSPIFLFIVLLQGVGITLHHSGSIGLP